MQQLYINCTYMLLINPPIIVLGASLMLTLSQQSKKVLIKWLLVDHKVSCNDDHEVGTFLTWLGYLT